MKNGSGTTWRPGEAFTLVEMLVVVTIIGLLLAIVLPTTVKLFTAGSDASAYNVLAGQLAAARSLAIQERTLAGVHAQLVDRTGNYTRKMPEACFTAVVQEVLIDPNNPTLGKHYVLAEGYSPQRMPGAVAFGRVDSPFWDPNTGSYEPTELSTGASYFTSLTFVFAPDGRLVKAAPATFDAASALFANLPNSRAYLWAPAVANNPACSASVNAAVMFDWTAFDALPPASRPNYLLQQGQLIAVNLYTGAPLGR
jgi:prepilin-type N-terminal cleavage/methylation domain-containing protein